MSRWLALPAQGKCSRFTSQRKLLKVVMFVTILATIILPFMIPLRPADAIATFIPPQISQRPTNSNQAVEGGGTRGRGPTTAQQQAQQQRQAAANATLQVVSYSVYGSDPRYVEGMVVTAKMVPSVYGPDWTVRIYHDATVPVPALEELRALPHVKLINVDQAFNPWVKDSCDPRAWRFLVAADPTVKAYLIRDSDSRPSLREKAAVDEWLQSGKAFHIMRDHPLHNPDGFAAILAGMWGGLRRALPNMEQDMRSHYLGRNKVDASVYGEDQKFLWDYMLPLAKNDVFQHDAYYCRETGGIAFPPDDSADSTRKRDTFVGDAFQAKDAYRMAWDREDDAERMKLFVYQCMTQKEHRVRFNECLSLRRDLIANSVNGTAASVNTSFVGLMQRNATYTSNKYWICPAEATVGKVKLKLRKNADMNKKDREWPSGQVVQ